MDFQRIRNWTTGKLHTSVDCLYKDLEFFTGKVGFMTHQLPNCAKAIEPWLKDRVQDTRFWNGKYDVEHIGELEILPMTDRELEAFEERYNALPHPFSQLLNSGK